MPAYHREQLATLLTRLGEEPRRLIVVAGPRQTGKTTLVRSALARVPRPTRYVPVDEPPGGALPLVPAVQAQSGTTAVSSHIKDRRWLADLWQTARNDAMESKRGAVLALDEIQNLPEWQGAVKGLWDADRNAGTPLHVVLLGSAPLLMQRGLTESLAGRFETIRMTHWSYDEMSTAFGYDLARYIYFGGYPGPHDLIASEDRWRDYIQTSLVEPNIERDILALERVDKPALLKRLFELCCEFSGQILSLTKMVGQLADAGNATTLARYLDLLEKAELVVGLQRYEGRGGRRRQSSPKLVVLNTALMSVHSGYTFAQAQADRTFWGRLAETAVGAHLVNTGGRAIRVNYWRQGDAEVDFVLERGFRRLLVEVKSNGRMHGRGRSLFVERFGSTPSLIVGGDGIPLVDFLSVPAERWFDEDQ